ncbi:tRNA (uridine(54)-C5)-methyltransferase TrmA [Catenovulum sp. 2E275]|uniref:tRNA (uridine(54)-C5)-methyltransferase TrmA n=1 Tax=Catenovulum sp. 2E275 TaxID=2980497 RepID=UPI0021D3AABB|nr:tRNA (uridine(54)-C5)-methyltransferase TrmA [Catenovulum sp. 2E275]MCU4676379.1 tRNA (uridine(54)-C5)-methyltransferase TrmA [Catenovulum sp. 2E275]
MRVDQIDISQYDALLQEKQQTTLNLFNGLNLPAKTNLVASPNKNYRLRAEFRVWHQDDDSFYIMFDPATKEKFRVDYFIPGSELLNQLMQAVRNYFLANETLRFKLYQVDFLTTLSGEALVSLIYHKKLDDKWLAEAKALKQTLNQIAPVNIIGRARKQKVLVEQDYVTEKLTVAGQTYSYQQVENSFTQPNGLINQAMLEWASSISAQLNGDLLELYCGNGNFSIALAKYFNKVLATEIARTSVKSAQHNLTVNQISNTIIGQSSAEDFSAAYFDGKAVKSLKELDLSAYQFNTILVDPPRAGLDQQTVELVKKFDNIIYVSCNPETLKDNLLDIQQTHQIKDLTLFDQFPYTHHIETGVWLTRR